MITPVICCIAVNELCCCSCASQPNAGGAVGSSSRLTLRGCRDPPPAAAVFSDRCWGRMSCTADSSRCRNVPACTHQSIPAERTRRRSRTSGSLCLDYSFKIPADWLQCRSSLSCCLEQQELLCSRWSGLDGFVQRQLKGQMTVLLMLMLGAGKVRSCPGTWRQLAGRSGDWTANKLKHLSHCYPKNE